MQNKATYRLCRNKIGIVEYITIKQITHTIRIH